MWLLRGSVLYARCALCASPTTLLAMVMPASAGRWGVDLPQGKNLVGAFKQPALVLFDLACLRHCLPAELRSGMAEVIKQAVIGDADLFVELEKGPRELSYGGYGGLVARACRSRLQSLSRMQPSRDAAAALNLATQCHALELTEPLMGCVTAKPWQLDWQRRHVWRSSSAKADISLPSRMRACSLVGLAACPPFDVDDMLLAMAHDKKRRGPALRWAPPVRHRGRDTCGVCPA